METQWSGGKGVLNWETGNLKVEECRRGRKEN